MKVTETATREREIQVAPCIECGGTDIILSDNNYSSFNYGGGKCKKCGHETTGGLAAIWNGGNDVNILIRIEKDKISAVELRIAEITRKAAATNQTISTASSDSNSSNLIKELNVSRASSDATKAAVLDSIIEFSKDVGDKSLAEAALAAMPVAHPFVPLDEWANRYKEGFRLTADTECGMDPDTDCDRCCIEYWQMILDDAGRTERLKNPYLGLDDGVRDATGLNEA